MIDNVVREMIHKLFEQGISKKEIARRLLLNIKTVRRALKKESGVNSEKAVYDITISEELLSELFIRCKGYAQRIQEILFDEYKIKIGYSTLTRRLRKLGLKKKKNIQHARVPDQPGKEMQHDTSSYWIVINGKRKKLIASSVYFRFSKVRYLRFYFRFNRFAMKCFFHEALMFFKYTAGNCIIDNTNLAVHYGTGSAAVFNEEMVRFAGQYGFNWKAHEIMHSNRKAGIERNFHTVETNFLPGREFKSIKDLNEQAFLWATEKFAKRPQSKTKLIPFELFEIEKPFLIPVIEDIHPPYLPFTRNVDQYGYIAFNANFFWTPYTQGRVVDIIEYSNKIIICIDSVDGENITYNLPADNVRNEQFCPPGKSKVLPQPSNRKKGYEEELSRLKKKGENTIAYLNFILSKENSFRQKPKFIRDLYYFSQKISDELFDKTVKRALEYKITTLDAVEKIASLIMTESACSSSLYDSESNAEYLNRQVYLDGRLSVETDLNQYEKIKPPEEEDETEDDKKN